MALNTSFTSTGAKFFAHEEAMVNLRNGKGQPIVTHVMLTDVCNHSCAFCSVHHRAGDSLAYDDILAYLDILQPFGLKAVILSGGGNPILYKNKNKNFNDVVNAIHGRGLQIGLITNGMPLKDYDGRRSWMTATPSTLDRLLWIRISMAGLDHDERQVFVPDVDPSKTTLGFSYVAHDIYDEPADKAHGKVSTQADLITQGTSVWRFEDRMDELEKQIQQYVATYSPKYVRLLPNCLEPNLIPQRVKQLELMAKAINFEVDKEVVFIQDKPPKAPKACYLGYIHPVLNCDGYVYPCDSCVLNAAADHKFNNAWQICKWQDVASLYTRKVRSLIADPGKTCPGCVFSGSNAILGSVVDGTADLVPPTQTPEHVNFV